MLDSRLAEEDFPVTPGVASAGSPGITQETEELPLLDIPFMLTSFLLSQVTPVYPLCPLLTLTPLSPGAGPLPGLAAAVSGRVWSRLSGCSPGLAPALDCAVCLVTSR